MFIYLQRNDNDCSDQISLTTRICLPLNPRILLPILLHFILIRQVLFPQIHRYRLDLELQRPRTAFSSANSEYVMHHFSSLFKALIYASFVWNWFVIVAFVKVFEQQWNWKLWPLVVLWEVLHWLLILLCFPEIAEPT